MRPEPPTLDNPCPPADRLAMPDAVTQLEEITARLMAVQRHWSAPDRDQHLAAALEASRNAWHAIQSALGRGLFTLPPEVQHNLLILSVYADSKISKCEAIPSAETLGSLIALTHALAGSLREWRTAA
ncbi:MAG: flagellar biosynthesis regulator FlaF [Thiobacillus sp.]